jgi:hypothetical protein
MRFMDVPLPLTAAITYVGARRIVLGTDCIWYGNPQPQFVTMRAIRFNEAAKELYNLPFGLDGRRTGA